MEEKITQYHSDEDWPLLNRDAPRSLRETSPIRPFAPRSSRETSPVRPFAPRSLGEMSPIRSYAPRSLRETSPVKTSIRFKHQTVKRPLEYEGKDMGHPGPPLPPTPYKGKGAPLETPWRRVLSSPEDEFDPHLEACFPVIFDDNRPGRAVEWEPIPMKMAKELKHACASYGPNAPYTMQPVEALAGRRMTPHDWKQLLNPAYLEGNMYFGELNLMILLQNKPMITNYVH